MSADVPAADRIHAAVTEILDTLGLSDMEATSVTVTAGRPIEVKVVRVTHVRGGVRTTAETTYSVEHES